MSYKFLISTLLFVGVSVSAEIIVDSSGLNSAVDETVNQAIQDKNERLEARRQSYSQGFVLVSSECISGLGEYCIADNIEIDTSYNAYASSNSGGSAGLHPSSNNKADLAGTYDFTVTLRVGNNGKKFCSGSFTLDGTENNVNINIYRSSCDYYVSKN